MTDDLHATAGDSAVTWACVEDGFYVASRGADLLGFVDRLAAGAFQVCDAQAQLLGMFPDLDSATRCLHASLTMPTRPESWTAAPDACARVDGEGTRSDER